MKQMPHFILAGYSKCATTSIAKYLEMHPSILRALGVDPDS
jgi:hypothetical protein